MSFSKQKAALEKLTMEQLMARREELIANAKPGVGVYLYDAKTNKKLKMVAWAVRDLLIAKQHRLT